MKRNKIIMLVRPSVCVYPVKLLSLFPFLVLCFCMGVKQTESWLCHGDLVGAVKRGRAGLGSFITPITTRHGGKVVVRGWEGQSSCGGGEGRQGSRDKTSMCLDRWEQAVERTILWEALWWYKPDRIRFLGQAVCDVPSQPIQNALLWPSRDTRLS